MADEEQNEEYSSQGMSPVDTAVNADSDNTESNDSGSNGGMFRNRFGKIKGKVKQANKENPYHRHYLLKKNVDFASGRNPQIKLTKKRFENQVRQRKMSGANVLQSDDDATKNEYEKFKVEEKKERKISRRLFVEVLAENVKAATDWSPAGCLKSIKAGCRSTIDVGVVVFVCSIIGILKLCGVF